MKLCFATNNAHKVTEVQQLLGDTFDIISLQDIGCTEELPETQPTLEGNARQKAEFVYQHYQVNCFADDTGLEIAALNGKPGVDSAHYAGPERNSQHNMQKVLDQLQGANNCQAQFRTIIALILEGKSYTFEGKVTGSITQKRSGQQGFGYDPIFIPEGYQQSFAEMSLEEKNQISHRGRAVQQLVHFLNNYKVQHG
ncbi:non-canonical purine NTP diphosphatase [Tunicatimonas pelagia]|uniref:non-canonical purine NTP diphosphatase n=1 Tax=Tunicatimonas pelagia TaxID=931531 RepID=UPI0026657C24|nr:non-canonical purine NTP diphosphatase [Tunicatimonas pelagia]WKN45074.1 non-canonical purine NTP diphosphatase [Tunicatimonas pelagia]